MTNPRRLNTKVMQGLFLLRERQRACSSRHAAGAALLLLVTPVARCSDVGLADEMPASETDPGYNNLVAKHLKDTFKNRASYDAFAISAFRWVHSFNGWVWMTCVRFEDNGHPRAYAVFIKEGLRGIEWVNLDTEGPKNLCIVRRFCITARGLVWHAS